jgi:hypothetical protein
LSIYIRNGRIYFNAWQRSQSPQWGGTNSNLRYAESHPIVANTNYIISGFFDRSAAEKIVIYVNGRKGARTETDAIGSYLGDNNIPNLGGLLGITRFHESPFSFTSPGPSTAAYHFNGFLAEFIMYNEPPLNETRRRIIENYLSGKYNIPLHNTDTEQVFDLAFANGSSATHYFGHQIAGAGIGTNITNDLHLDSQGPGVLRVKLTDTDQLNSTVMWGHNNVPLNSAYPYSSAFLPDGIVERSGRVWKVFKTGTTGPMDLYLNFSGIQDAPLFIGADLKLLHHLNHANPQDFSGATIVAADSIRSGPVVEFRNLNIPSGSYIALASSSTILPLPIELLSFTAKLLGDIVSVNWSTATETNNDYFEVQRCGADLNWEQIAIVPGAGNSNSTLHYTHYDRDPLKGISYYRLKQVDYDGQFSYSDIAAVVNLNNEVSDDLFIYPNPSRGGSVFVRVPAAYRTESTAIKIYSTFGQLVFSGRYDTNTDLVEVKYGKLQAGVYYIAVESELITTGSKLVIY